MSTKKHFRFGAYTKSYLMIAPFFILFGVFTLGAFALRHHGKLYQVEWDQSASLCRTQQLRDGPLITKFRESLFQPTPLHRDYRGRDQPSLLYCVGSESL
jgi:hypothetical protein